LQKTSPFNLIKLFNKDVSKKIIEDIHSGNKINFKNELLASQKEKILRLKRKYEEKKIMTDEKPRNWIFWQIIESLYMNYEIKFIKKKSSNISNKSKFKKNICNTTFTKKIGFNPSIIALIIFEKEIKKKLEEYNESFFACTKFWPPTNNELEKIKSTLKKKDVQLISVLCPDYSFKEIGKNFYSFTFEKLNSGIGLGGQKLSESVKKIYDFLKKKNISFSHEIFFGDFEAYTKENCIRLGIEENKFLERVRKSKEKMRSLSFASECNLFVERFCSKEEWLRKKKEHKTSILEKFSKDQKFEQLFYKIAKARKNLYGSWYPEMTTKSHFKLVIDQAAEYSLMGEYISYNYENPLIIGADHPLMRIFYYFKEPISVIYLSKNY
tara:strand:+ start:549 stop:1694 length:1146 start_codon:yes stop_codon:yes gene_type:complete